MSQFKLSDPGKSLVIDTTMAEYLQAYGLPIPPEVRYGYARIHSPQEKYRVSLMAQAWLPHSAIGTILLIHGYAEHTGNYAHLIQDFVNQKFAVIALDLRGHGLSEGIAAHTPLPHLYAEDVETVVSSLFSQVLPSQPLYVWAHSLGALVGLQVLLRGRLPIKPAAAVFTSPLLGFPKLTGLQGVLAKLSPFLSKIVPALPVSHDMDPGDLSHDEEYLAKRLKDPMIKRVTTPKWFESTKEAVADMQRQAENFLNLSPTLLMLAGDERITNLPEARRFAFRAYGSQQHKVIEFPGAFHELEKEKSIRTRIVNESIAWLRSHR